MISPAYPMKSPLNPSTPQPKNATWPLHSRRSPALRVQGLHTAYHFGIGLIPHWKSSVNGCFSTWEHITLPFRVQELPFWLQWLDLVQCPFFCDLNEDVYRSECHKNGNLTMGIWDFTGGGILQNMAGNPRARWAWGSGWFPSGNITKKNVDDLGV